MVFLKVVLVGLASPRGLTVQCFPQEYFSPPRPFNLVRCVGPYLTKTLSLFIVRCTLIEDDPSLLSIYLFAQEEK